MKRESFESITVPGGGTVPVFQESFSRLIGVSHLGACNCFVLWLVKNESSLFSFARGFWGPEPTRVENKNDALAG